MPPTWPSSSRLFARSPVGDLSAQWRNPKDILSVLLILGPDIVQSAVAQLAGRFITPVAFSFGWVAYAASALLSSVGDGRLMPAADVDNTIVIGAKSGHARATKSWVLGRLLRDFDDLVDENMTDERTHVPPDANCREQSSGRGKPWEALRVTVLEVEDNPPTAHGVPKLDWVWFSGLGTIIIQLAISAVPWIIYGNWDTFMVVLVGNFIALLEGSLPQWGREKWDCPKTGGSTVTITRGNGSRHAVTILGKRGVGLDLEILARGTRKARASRLTKIATAGLAILWILLLVFAAGIEQDTWYLLGVGILGSIQNIVAASVARTPGALGIHLKHVETIRAARVAEVLRKVETRYEFVGTSLLDVFFPGSLRVKEAADIEFWQTALDKRMRPNDHGTRLDCLLPLLVERSEK